MKKGLIIVLFVCGILLLGAVGGVFFDAYAAPRLASVPWFAEKDFFKTLNERVTIINKTEQVVIREDDTVEKIVSQPATAVVGIILSSNMPAITGVFLTNDGLVATYVEKPVDVSGKRVSVILFDGSSVEADFIGQDTLTNLAFFRLTGSQNTPAISFANSDDARAGKRLITLGYAETAYQNRLSVGVLGNVNRAFNLSGKTVASSEKWEGVFETDFNAPERFAGGPVIGFNGEMEGILGTLTIDNTMQAFVIPANAVRESFERAISGTLEKRAYLGVYYLPITKALTVSRGLSRDRGAFIYAPSGKTGLAVIADSPAAKAGLLVNDIIVSVNGKEIDLVTPLPKILSRLDVGTVVECVVLRNGEERTVQITL